jgi:general secretion pathway protein C
LVRVALAAVFSLTFSCAAHTDVEAPAAPAPIVEAKPVEAKPVEAQPVGQSVPPGLDLSPWRALPPSPPIHIPRAALRNSEELVKSMRVVPAYDKDATLIGLKLFSFRPGTVLSQIGLQNSDILVGINDMPVATPEQALAADEAFRTARTATLNIRRRGEPIRIDLVLE